MTFTPDSGGSNLMLSMGSAQGTEYPNPINKRVVEVETCNDNPTTGFRFHHADTAFTDVNFLSCTESNLTKLCGNFIGLFCSWN